MHQIPAGTVIPDSLRMEWEQWLQENFDPGHYGVWKDKETGQWQVDTDMPDHLYARLAEFQKPTVETAMPTVAMVKLRQVGGVPVMTIPKGIANASKLNIGDMLMITVLADGALLVTVKGRDE